MNEGDDLAGMAARYARRAALPADRYAPLQPDVLARVHERQRALAVLLAAQGLARVDWLNILEVGCGNGGNLVEWLALGATPECLAGNELLPDRLAAARARLPAAVALHGGDAAELALPETSQHIVQQSTVFSSILDPAAQQHLATAMWRWVKPGGAVLWYDFTFDNPRNPDVRGVPLARIRELFPEGRITAKRVTLAPPLARAVVRVHPALYTLSNALPLLRTHLLCWIAKP
jgi:SAM-dependent methyltransferase